MKQHIRTHRTHSDDLRSTSEPETEGRWNVARPDSTFVAASHQRNVSQLTEPGAQPVPGSAPNAP